MQNYLISWVFGVKRSFEQRSEANGYCRSNLAVAKDCFDDLVAEIRGNNSTIRYKDLIRYQNIVRDYIFDVKPIAEHLERQRNPNYLIFSGHRSHGV